MILRGGTAGRRRLPALAGDPRLGRRGGRRILACPGRWAGTAAPCCWSKRSCRSGPGSNRRRSGWTCTCSCCRTGRADRRGVRTTARGAGSDSRASCRPNRRPGSLSSRRCRQRCKIVETRADHEHGAERAKPLAKTPRESAGGNENAPPMTKVRLTLKSVRARPVVVPLKRPVVSKVGLFREWPLILIDLHTHQGVVGHSYLEPYLKQSGALHRSGARGSRVRPCKVNQWRRSTLIGAVLRRCTSSAAKVCR